jgi:HSP20 family protein
MLSLMPWRKKEDRAATGGALAPSGDFPFMLSRLRDEFDRLFEDFALSWNGQRVNGWRWGLDVRDEENTVVVRAEAPGFEAGDFDVQVKGDQLVLKAARKATKEDMEKGYREEESRECFQAVTLPAGVDADKVSAAYRNGVLTITLPKTADGKGKKIAVKNG